MFAWGVFAPGETLRTASLIPAAIVLVLWLLSVHSHFTPHTAGANDNASGVGVLLALAGRLKAEPLAGTEVWLVATGCEEVGAGGSQAFVREHGEQFREGGIISVDNIAGKGTGPVYLRSEGIVLPRTYTGALIELADRLAQSRPELGARAAHQRGASTDGLPALNAGITALSFVGYTVDGWVPNWHHPDDTVANVDADSLDRAERFVWELLHILDDRRPTTGDR
jgi:Zn-dependent M28 family amino/carboxypeptidase